MARDLTIEPVRGAPAYLALGAWRHRGIVYEIASRPRLDSRQVVPTFVHDGVLHAGVLERERASRAVRGGELHGWEPIGIDLAGVDETGDVLSYGNAIFTARAGVAIDERVLAIALPSYAKSIGYLSELGLPLSVAIEAPPSRDLSVTWDGATHVIRFRPIDELVRAMRSGAVAYAEDLLAILCALTEPARDEGARWPSSSSIEGARFLEREAARITSAAELSASLHRAASADGFERLAAPRAEDLRFLRLSRVVLDGRGWDVVSPRTHATLAMLPYVVANGTAYFLLWRETRPAALERRARTPIFDTPVHVAHVNATACFLDDAGAARLGSSIEALAGDALRSVLGGEVRALRVERLAAGGEPAPGTSSEVRHRVACELDPASLPALPPDVLLVEASELARAIADGAVRDPVVVLGLRDLAARHGLDPFADARRGDVAERLAFVAAMTAGSVVERRLRSYSSIEQEQLGAPTYARLMTLLQHEYGVRVAYPRTETDRGFFKAAFRVFMAAGRDEDRAVQGLHWSHDAFHFGLGNFTLPPAEGFAEWFVSGAPLPAAPAPEGEPFETYYRALKAAEDEATFFSFYTLFAEQPSLARHVGKLTFWQATVDLGVACRSEARAIFDDVTSRATLPDRVRDHAAYARPDVRALFDYMLGFRDYHRKDIAAAFAFAARDPYRGFFLRYRLYEHDLARYLAAVRGFAARLEATPPGLSPLLAALADVRVEHASRVWDVVKALRLCRAALGKGDDDGLVARRRTLLALGERFFVELDAIGASLASLRRDIVDAELTPRNERILAAVRTVAARVEDLRMRLWDAAAETGLLAPEVVRDERARELPRLRRAPVR